MATANGYGEPYERVSDSGMQNIMKAQYAANILFIASMCFSKLALIRFVRDLTPASFDRRFAVSLQGLTSVWALVGIITAAFQCKPPRTWDYLEGQCFRLDVWWDYLGVSNILTEMAIVVQAVLVIARVQTNVKKKVTLASVFALRILFVDPELPIFEEHPANAPSVIVAILCQIVYARQTAHSTNITSDTWPVAISTQLAQCFSIVTACSPQFKPFMESLRSTGMRIDGMTRYGTSQKGYGSQSASRASTLGSRSRHRSEVHELVSLPAKDSHHQATVTTAGAGYDWDAESQTSQSRIIREVRTFTVTDAPRSSGGESQ
ncbi:uncharacterized protein LDX57_000037 [Aspergillus melleus]|uniref:uncharacterized protein n=1 Tax=Aspergillus melleus TaxID=138277 RepID=UPI001E8D968C|nr:uncharacterized protein LDX57_000037 [Aspergillus melleus]KAH8422279.1 hypothetical protein LDX57_000037 [Aspergillus melleus]